MERKKKGVMVLCKTSNLGSGELQDLKVGSKRVWELLAEKVANEWNEYGNCMLVVGATYTDDLRKVRKIVEDAYRLAVVPCTCRLTHGDCGKPVDVCIQINRAADYTLERKTGRELTKEEAIDMLKLCEDEGLVHITDNKRSMGNLICNCCEDCCINWPGNRKANKKFVAPSRFIAAVDADLCTGCEVCIDRCYFDAITMDGEGGTALINEENCMGCGLCLVTCDVEAMSLKEERAEDFIQD